MKRSILLLCLAAACHPNDGATAKPSSSADSASGAVVSQTPAQGTARDTTQDNALLEKADAARIQGSKTAAVWVVEISDFQCPFCKRFHDSTYARIVKEYVTPGIVRMAYVNLPLQMHPNAQPAAEAAMCAAAQDRFWQMHDKLFNTQEKWGPMARPASVIDSLAVSTGLNATDWRACMNGGVMRRLINADKSRAAASGVRSTPTFFIGSEVVEGAQPFEDFKAAIERARAKAAGAPK